MKPQAIVRHWQALAVFCLSYLVALAAYQPVLGLPITRSDEVIVIVRNADEAPLSSVLIGREEVEGPETFGRYFRPLSLLTFHLEALAPGSDAAWHRYASLAYLALLSVAAFWLMRRICGRMTGSAVAVLAAVAVGLVASFAASESGSQLEPRSSVFLALFTIVMTATLLALHFPRTSSESGIFRSRPTTLLMLGAAVLGAAASKETGPLFAVALVAALAASRLLGRPRPTLAQWAPTAAVVAAPLAFFFVLKLASGGAGGLVVSSVRLTISDVTWNIRPLDEVLGHVGPIGSDYGYAVSNAIRNVIATLVPAFTDYGAVIGSRLPFLAPFVLLVAFVVAALARSSFRPPLLGLSFAVVILAAISFVSLRPRSLLPAYSLWLVAVGVAAAWLWQRRSIPKWLIVTTLALTLFVSFMVARNAAVTQEAAAYHDLYVPLTYDEVERRVGYAQYLEDLRRSEGCELLGRFRSFQRTRDTLERVSSFVAGIDVRRVEGARPTDELSRDCARAASERARAR